MSTRTPNSPGFQSTQLPAPYLSQSSIALSHILTRLSTKCDPTNVQNPSAKKVLSDMQSQALDACSVVDESRPDYGDFPLIQPGTDAADLARALSETFDNARKKLAEFLISSFDIHVRKALALTRLFSADAETITVLLRNDRTALGPVFEAINAACSTFTRKWTRIRDQARNESIARITGEKVKQTYAVILEKYWEAQELAMSPSFPANEMDMWSISSINIEMQHLGREWARGLLPPSVPSPIEEYEVKLTPEEQEKKNLKAEPSKIQQEEDVMRRIAEVDEKIRTMTKVMESTISATDLQKINSPVDIALTWSDIIGSLKDNPRDKYLRLCIFGKVNHGKTSVINSLIGRVFLHAEDKASTAWPLIIRHVPGKKPSKLTINQDHFTPYLKFIRRRKFSALWDALLSRGEGAASSRGLNVLGASQTIGAFMPREQFTKFEDPEFKFPVSCEDPKKIQTILKDINHLMRCCYTLATKDAPFPDLENVDWPCVEMEFGAWKGETIKLEMLDLPGLDEKRTRMPEHIFDISLRNGVDGCLLTLLRDTHSEGGIANTTMQSFGASDEPPLAAIATRSERKMDTYGIRGTIADSVWTNRDLARRVVYGAPGLYASAVSALIQACNKEGCAGDTNDIQSPLDPTSPLPDLPEYWKALPCTVAVYEILTETPDEEIAIENYQNFGNIGAWKQELERSIKVCKQKRLVDHFKRYAIGHGADRRQFYALADACTKLRRLIAAQSDFITMALEILSGGAEVNTDLYDKALEILQPWHESGEDEIKKMEKTLATERAVILKKAVQIVENEVKAVIPKQLRKIDKQGIAIKFINDLGDNIQQKLAQLAADYVFDIRKIANEAWTARVISLANKLREVDTLFPLELMDSLHANSIDPGQAVREATTKRLLELTDDPKKADEHWKQAMAKTWLPHLTAQAELAGMDLKDKLSLSEKTVVESLNELGYLLRAPVSTNPKSSPFLNDSNWPQLTGSYPVWLVADEVVTTFTKALVDPWIELLGSESQTSVVGSMKKASSVADGQLTANIKRRIEWRKQTRNINANLITPQFIDGVALQHARCCSLYGAIDEVCKRWREAMFFILPKAYKGSRDQDIIEIGGEEGDKGDREDESDGDDGDEIQFQGAAGI